MIVDMATRVRGTIHPHPQVVVHIVMIIMITVVTGHHIMNSLKHVVSAMTGWIGAVGRNTCMMEELRAADIAVRTMTTCTNQQIGK